MLLLAAITAHAGLGVPAHPLDPDPDPDPGADDGSTVDPRDGSVGSVGSVGSIGGGPTTGAPGGAGPAPVVGGDEAPVGAWTDTAALYSSSHQLLCSGVLVAPNVVLTAGHCAFSLDHVVLGTNNLRRGGEQIAIVDMIQYPDSLDTLDGTVLILEHDATITAPRRMALDCEADQYVTAGADVVIAGFGATDTWATEWTNDLHEAFTTIRDPVCADLDAGCNEAVSPGGELIAGGDGIDSCSGDSGGPLYLRTPVGDLLVGITSRGALPFDTPCGDGGIYVRADALAEWVEAEAGITLPRPDCTGYNYRPRPEVEPVEVPVGGSAIAVIDPNDPDADQTHTFRITAAPTHGIATLDRGPGGAGGAVLYLAPAGWTGDDALTVTVTDDGDPAQAADVVVPVRVVGVEVIEPGGCATGGAGATGLASVAAIVALVGRRRR
ncbi:MAG: trypsin-like serine protease [Myxococcota bacterium]